MSIPNTPTSGMPAHDWSSSELIDQKPEKKIGLVAWWYRSTSAPEPSQRSSFVKREAWRRGHLLSTVVFFLMLTITVLIPATLFIQNHAVLFLCIAMLVICMVALLINRTGKTLFASIIVVTAFEGAFLLVIASTIPFDVPNLPLYDLLTMTELLAASLLPQRNVFLVALLNSVFIGLGLRFQPHTPALASYLHAQFYSALIRPISLQILVAVVVYLWVQSTVQAIARADRAEMLARLEHALAEQKNQLEIGIQQILQTHTEIANGYLDVRSPLTKENVLWPLANALNNLLSRFQRSQKAEQELQYIWVLLPEIVNRIQEAERRGQPIAPFPRTKTSLDPLLSWLSGKTLYPQQSTFSSSSRSQSLQVEENAYRPDTPPSTSPLIKKDW